MFCKESMSKFAVSLLWGGNGGFNDFRDDRVAREFRDD